MNLSAIHKYHIIGDETEEVVCDIGGYEFVSYSQDVNFFMDYLEVVCDIGGYEFVSYSQAVSNNVLLQDGCL